MKIAVTGASGHLGNVLCRCLIKENHTVKALYFTNKRGLEKLNIETIQGNILNIEDVENLVKDCDVVFHCAAIISISRDLDNSVYNTNVNGTRNVLDASIKHKVKKFIYVSSIHVASENPQDEPLDEERAYKEKRYAYEASKVKAEKIVLSAFKNNKIKGCIVRPSSIVGPYDFIPSAFGKALLDFRAKKIPLLPPGGYDLVDVRDVAQAMVNSISNLKHCEIYHLTGKYHTIKEVALQVKNITGVKTPELVLPYWLMVGLLPLIELWSKITKAAPVFTIQSISTIKNGHKNMVNSKAQKDLNLNYRSITETITDFYKWYDYEY